MRKLLLSFLGFYLFSISSTAQIDGNLLLGLTTVKTAEIGTITSPISGSIIYNSEDKNLYIYNGSNFVKVPSLDANSNNFWKALGNTSTDPSLQFIGTTDVQNLIFKTNNTEAFRILSGNQYIGIGVNIPSERLDVNGSLRLRSIAATTSDLDVLVTTSTGVVQKRIFADFIGPTGPTGTNGTDGVSVTNAIINGSDELVLTLSDTSTINTGTVLGPQGPQGNDGTDGTNVTDATINSNNELVFTMSDTSTINAGQVIDSKLNFGARWTNTDITTNLNADNTIVPIFGTENYKDDGTNLYEVTGNTLTVKETGRYQIIANLSLIADPSSNSATRQRTNTNARIAIGGTPIGAVSATGYIRYGSTSGIFYNTSTSLQLNEILELNANDVVTIISYRKGNSGVVFFSAANESSFTINKLR